jgi:GcrA cell cycle regulator
MADKKQDPPKHGTQRWIIHNYAMRAAGKKTCSQIAEDLGVIVDRVHDVVRVYEIPVKAAQPGTNVGTWTDERIEALKRLWCIEGLSTTQIAAELGGGITRNAVIGKVNRLGLIQASKIPDKFKARKKKKASGSRPREQSPWAARWTIPIEPLPLTKAADDVARKALADLENHECRFPVGDPRDPGFGFCAAERAPGRPYCADHAARAYVRPVRQSDTSDTSDTSKQLKTHEFDTSSDVSGRVKEGV